MSARELAAEPLADEDAAPTATPLARAVRTWRRVNAPVATESPTRPVRELFDRRLVLEFVVLIALVSVGIVSVFHLGSLRVPYIYNGDAVGYGGTIRTLLDTGWVQHTPRLGAPFGQDMYDQPLGGDNGNYLVLKFMTFFSKDWGLLLNLFYLAGFYFNAVSAWFCARLLGCSRLTAIGLAILYDFVQFHFWRYGHTLLANYFILPVAVVLAVRAAHGRSYDARTLRSRWAWWPSLVTLLACVAAGSFGAYWAVFAAITIAFFCAATALSLRTVRPLLHGVLVSGTILVVLVANEAQSLLYEARNGHNPLAVARQAIEQDRYGLRLIQMIAPTPGGHFNHGILARITTTLFSGYPTEASESLGLVGAAVLILMLAWVVVRLVSQGIGRPPAGGSVAPPEATPVAATVAGATETEEGAPTETAPTATAPAATAPAAAPAVTAATMTPQLMALGSLFWILLATTGGLDWLIWLTGFHDIRSWGRASILIMFMALIWAGLLLTRWQQRRQSHWSPRGRVVVSLVMVAVFVFGFFEETPSQFPTHYPQTIATYTSDKDFFAGLEKQLPASSMVFNLPIRRYPEEPPTYRSADYAMLIPFNDTRTLRFSYGGMKGRQSEWQQWLLRVAPNPDQLLDAVAAVGFHALLIDTYGYRDNGASLTVALESLLGEAPMTSRDGRWIAFSLTDWLTTHPPSAALHDRLLKTPLLVYGTCGQSPTDLVCAKNGSLMVTTPIASTDQPLTLSVTSPNGPGTFRVQQHGTWTSYRIGAIPVQIPISAGSKTYTYFSYDSATPPASGGSPSMRISQVLPPLFPQSQPVPAGRHGAHQGAPSRPGHPSRCRRPSPGQPNTLHCSPT